jgi:hypothetical protein
VHDGAELDRADLLTGITSRMGMGRRDGQPAATCPRAFSAGQWWCASSMTKLYGRARKLASGALILVANRAKSLL